MLSLEAVVDVTEKAIEMIRMLREGTKRPQKVRAAVSATAAG
jgi:hypothetical protein